MGRLFYNTGYFIKEVKKIVTTNLLSNVFSLLSTGLIFFILILVLSGWWVSNQAVEIIKGEAEVSVYLKEGLPTDAMTQQVAIIQALEGVKAARIVPEDEAYERMVKILGKEANILTYFDQNPFSAFIEVNIDLGQMTRITETLSLKNEVSYVRDNQEVLSRLMQISKLLRILGYLIVFAVGITTLVIVAHMIRQGIYNNRDQINTLKLLGAPSAFIALPFIIEGILLTLLGGALALGMANVVISQAYRQIVGPLPFIPLPPKAELINAIYAMVCLLSVGLGLAGSLFGLASSKSK